MTYAEAFEELVAAVKRFEGCRLTAYKCPAGIWTIGYGETQGIREGMIWTQEKADATLRQRLGQFMLSTMKRCLMLFLEPPERAAACTSLSYNIGVGAFGASSVCRKTNRGEFDQAAEAFLLWNKAAGRVLRGLTIRRQYERNLYRKAGQ